MELRTKALDQSLRWDLEPDTRDPKGTNQDQRPRAFIAHGIQESKA